MSRLRAWTWKEAREHRWALVGAWLAVALVTSLPFVAFDEETTRGALDQLPGVAVALATLVLGLDLFARETRRSTHALILRTPGAMRWAFPAKLLVFVLGTLGALAIEELLRHPLEAVTGIPLPYRITYFEGEWRRIDRPILPGREFGIPTTIYLACLAAAVGSWHVAGSVVAPRAGVGALCGVSALGVLCVPFLLMHAQHPWWFRPSPGEAYAWIAGIGAAGLLVAGLAWYSGRRFLLPRSAALLRGGLVALVLAGLAAGGAAYAIDRWEAADPRAPEFRIEGGFLGSGGKRLYLTTSRGSMYGDFTGSGRQTPPSAWAIELGDPGRSASHVRLGSSFMLPPGIARTRALVPIPFVVRVDQDLPHLGSGDDPWTWIDATTGDARLLGGARTLSAVTIEAARATAKAQTPLRDSKGRRVWWVEGAVERDGDENLVPVPASSDRREGGFSTLMPSGFVVEGPVRDPARRDAGRIWQRWKIDAETGDATREDWRAPPDPPGIGRGQPSGGTWMPLGGSRFLLRRSRSTPAGAVEMDTGWLLWDAAVPDRFEPAPGAPSGWDVAGATEGRLLAREDTGPEQSAGEIPTTKLVEWNPSTGEHVAVACADASLLSPGYVESLGILPDGRRLIRLYDRTGFRVGRQALVLLDVATRTLTPTAPWSSDGWDPVAFDADGSLLVIEGSRRVVRLSEEGRTRDVVWPR